MENFRTVFFVSDRTGITAETFGHSLIAQFDNFNFKTYTLPYVDNLNKAIETIEKINNFNHGNQARPIIFATIVDPQIRSKISQSNAMFIDLYSSFIASLEKELSSVSAHATGRIHNIATSENYNTRIEAVNFALDTDDGTNTKDYMHSDVILVGVSRSGKTPTCLYLALLFGIRAANYPITEEDLLNHTYPKHIRIHRRKIVGLTIEPHRLSHIRNERKRGSKYASIEQCEKEVKMCEELFKLEGTPYLNSTTRSIEEISTQIMVLTGIERRLR